MITAFQIGAFQFTGFQEGAGAPSGSIPWWLISELRAKRKRKALPAAEPTGAEVIEAIRNIRARVNWRATPPQRPRTSLQPIIDAIRVAREAADMEAFQAEVAEFDAIIAAEDWEYL